MSLHDQVVVFSDARPALAYLVRSRLAEEGIDAFIVNESLQQGANELLPSVIGPRVAVAVDDAVRAKEIVAEFQAEGAAQVSEEHVPEDIDLHDLEGHGIRRDRRGAGVTINVSTAECPECRHARMTVCPYCHTASAAFPAADHTATASAAGEPELVICQTCDEPFPPEYFRHCEWCGHDFGSGIEPEPQQVAQYLNDRVIVAVMATGMVLLAILAYFATLLK